MSDQGSFQSCAWCATKDTQIAALRQENILLRGYEDAQRQSCKRCGRREGQNFIVSNEDWQAIVAGDPRTYTLCIVCFDLLAEEAERAYTITHFTFAGLRGGFDLDVQRMTALQEENRFLLSDDPKPTSKFLRNRALHKKLTQAARSILHFKAKVVALEAEVERLKTYWRTDGDKLCRCPARSVPHQPHWI